MPVEPSTRREPPWQNTWVTGTGYITRSRRNRNDEGEALHISRETTRDLRAIRLKGPKPEDPVFGITAYQMRTQIRAATKAAGLGDGYIFQTHHRPGEKADAAVNAH